MNDEDRKRLDEMRGVSIAVRSNNCGLTASCIDWLISQIEHAEAERDKLREALQSIAANTCCGPCQEAATVARAALEEKP